MKNSKMQSKAEETAAIQALREKAAAGDRSRAGSESQARHATEAGQEEKITEAIGSVAPQDTVSDPHVPVEQQEGRSSV